jgi:ribulose-phosphate 3-epimerase
MKGRIAASLAAAPLENLGQVIHELETAGVDYLHFDLEDGIFVPAMTLGTRLIAEARRLSTLPFDVHLMISNPEWILPDLLRCGVDRISIHYEACAYPRRVLHRLVDLGIQAGIALNPATPLLDLHYLLPYLSFVVVLTTEPELPECSFLPENLSKIRLGKKSPSLKQVEWIVDGGVTLQNIEEIMEAGADTVVVGRAIFADGRPADNIAALRAAR